MIQKMPHAHTLMTILAFIVVSPLFCPVKTQADEAPAQRILWYTRPAQDWEKEALPIGNGRLGAMVFGDVVKEHIQFNEDSLWIGDEKDTGAYQAFGDLYIEMAHQDHDGYRRELDISRAIHTTTYQNEYPLRAQWHGYRAHSQYWGIPCRVEDYREYYSF